MITGSGKQKSTKWGGGSIACKTSFKSAITIVKKDGSKINPITIDNEIAFDNVEKGDKIQYEVFTGADGNKGKSDEFFISITSLNWSYLINQTIAMYDSARPQQIASWERNKNLFYKNLAQKINPSLMFLTYFSNSFTTDSEGYYKGEYTVNNLPSGPMTVNLIYGYDQNARTSDVDRAWNNAIDVGSWVLLAVEIIVALAICGATAGVGCVIAAGFFKLTGGAELIYFTHEHLSKGLVQSVGLNKYGCSFPEEGYVHSYGIQINDPTNDPFNQLSEEDLEGIKAVNPKLGGFNLSKEHYILGISLAGLFLLVYSIAGSE
jgi:hypothetical protein